MTTAGEFSASFRKRHASPSKTNWKKKFRAAEIDVRAATIDEAISSLRREARTRPLEWQRGYNSAITILELMRVAQPQTPKPPG